MEKAKAIVNGIVGDHLDETDNELATVMGFYTVTNNKMHGGGDGGGGEPIHLSSILTDYQRTTTNATDTTEEMTTSIHLCIFVHGLTDNESVWATTKHCENYGELLAKEQPLKGLVICYLRYNTGLHVSTNGQRLAELLDEQLVATTVVVQEITFICHSMGGLVARSACLHSWNMDKYGAVEGGGMYGGGTAGDPSASTTTATSGWIHRVGRIIFLGTPHHGSFWEKLGNVASTGMRYTPYLRIASDVANLRSSGIKDLRYGYLQEEDWQGHDPDAFLTNTKCIAEVLPWIHYYVASGTITTNPNHLLSYWVGDALVRRDSAHGQSTTIGHSLGIPPCNTREFPGVSHMRLTNHRQVYEQIQEWISQPSDRGRLTALTDRRSHQEKAQTISTSPNFHPNQNSCSKNTSIPKQSNWAQAKGAIILLETAVDKGSSAIEQLQDQITKQVYEVVSTVIPAARTVETIHSKISKGVFNSIRLVNYGVGTIAKVTFAMLEDNSATRNYVDA